MRGLYIRKKLLVLLISGMILLLMGGASVMAVTADTNMITVAKGHKISTGNWKKTVQGIRYKTKNGKFVTDKWCTIKGKIYYFDKKGYVKTGSFKYNGKYYYANSSGVIYVNRWRKSDGKNYYYKSDGVRAKGWVKVKGKTYFFNRIGEQVKNGWVGNQYVGKNGTKVVGKTVQGRKIDKNGVIKTASKKDKYIFIGASHGVDMSIAVNSSDTIFITKGGEGLAWLKSTAGPQLMTYLKRNSDYAVIFQLGGNDLGKVDGYIQYYKKLIKKYPKTRFYFLENLPGDGKYSLTYKNEAKKKYDKKLYAAFGSKCIKVYEYMEKIGYHTVDGLHYEKKDIKKVYNHMISEIEKKEKQIIRENK